MLLYGRNPEKLAEIEAKTKGGKTHVIDFAKASLDEYQKVFENEESKIPILINNVGMGV